MFHDENTWTVSVGSRYLTLWRSCGYAGDVRAQALWYVSSHPPAGPLMLTVSVKKERWLQICCDLLAISHLTSFSTKRTDTENDLEEAEAERGRRSGACSGKSLPRVREAMEGEVGPVAHACSSSCLSLYLLAPLTSLHSAHECGSSFYFW